MTNALRRLIGATSVLPLLGLMACGGGSDGGPGSAAGPVVPAKGAALAVSTSNYQDVAVDAVNTAVQFAGQSSVATLTGSLAEGTVPCAGGGSIRASLGAGRDGVLNEFGETATLTFNACAQDGYVFNGQLTLGLTAKPTGSVGSGVYSVDAALLMSGFSANDGRVTLVANGLVDLHASRTGTDTGVDTVRTSALALGLTPSGGSQRLYALHDFVSDTAWTAGARAATYAGSLTSSLWGNRSVDFQTTTPFTTAAGATFPSDGVAIALGSGGSKATLTVLDATQVRLDLDRTGDSTVDATTSLSWSAIL
ncbi:hypothetical protein [Leptothrix discophora]|uniref:Lipoprotein n=1 Tax=Leptothrix discophora TaxID=89 RepID=A0ABT9G7X7_LEPDI|nr:hypothetical protein [Leptothrix discophora]MDP4302584.1 hypothetical protein [Leptothrix discophora]